MPVETIMTHTTTTSGRLRRSLAVLAAAFALTGCDDILDVVDPDLVTPASINQAELYWAGALGDFQQAANGGSGVNPYVGLFTDEFHLSGTFPTRIEIDERNISTTNGTYDNVYQNLHHARNSAENAAELLTEEVGESDVRVGQMYNVAAYTYVMFGEVFCSGVPFGRTPVNGDQVMGEVLERDAVFQEAITRFDRAQGFGNAALQNAARVGKARALMGLGQYAAAAAEVASVPDDFVFWIRHDVNASGGSNAIHDYNWDQGRWSISEQEGTNGVAFRSAMDPRLPWEEDDEPGFDASTPLYLQLIWRDDSDDMPLATGLEARLIEAEGALNAGDVAGWLGMLNALRTDVGLGPLTDPGSEKARARTHFEERAFWLFGQGHRLGDLRRMVRHYGFSEDEVFPTGQHFKGSAYGNQMAFPVPQEETNNPNYSEGVCDPTKA